MAKSRNIRLGDTYPSGVVSPASRLAKLAQQVRETYCRFYRLYASKPSYGLTPIAKWDGGFDAATGNTYRTPIWPKLVEFFIRNNIDPAEYIKLQFASSPANRLPYPNMLTGPVGLANWAVHARLGLEKLRMRTVSDINSLELIYMPLHDVLQWPLHEAVEYAVRDKNCSASSLTRYILAVEHQLVTLIDMLESAAVGQYAFEAVWYDEILGARIPATIRDQAVILRRSFQ